MTQMQNIADQFLLLGLISSLFFNSTLIFLTLFYIKHIVPSYKNMIVTFASLGIAFVAWEHVAQPYVHNFNASFIYFSMNTSLSHSLSKVALGVYGGLYSSLISFTALQFAFRHLTVKKSRILEQKAPLAVFAVVYVIVFGVSFGGSLYLLGEPSDYEDGYLEEEMRNVYNLQVTEVPRLIILPYDPNGQIRLNSFISSFICISVVSIQYLIIIYCTIQMNANIHRNLSHCSHVHAKLEKQFFKALIVQITLPTLLLTLPSFPVLLCPFLNIEMSVESGFIYTLFSFYTPLDSLSFMIIVSEYRIRIREMCQSFKESMMTGEPATTMGTLESVI